MTIAYPATERQVDYLISLLASRVVASDYRADISARIDDGTLDSRTASSAIDYLRGAPKPDAVVANSLPVGMYRTTDGTIYRVHESRESGRHYAKRMEYDLFSDKPRFVYDRGAIMRLTMENRMTLAEAKAWGVETGFCCVCGAFLTDERSVAEGIGPVCAKRV
jgi:hypothetical protein